ncbi:hypothetical protein V3C99_004214 [Haemonchus contortus]
MSILAEPRRRQRLSVDPQNVQWKNDDQKISRKLMERMGWSDGDGLGRNCQGSSSNVKLKANYTGKGLGADKLASYDSTWIGHHDDFADLLSALNKNKEQKATTDEEKQERAKKISLELNSKSLRRRIHYQKFTRAKDISNFTENDRAAVLGIGLSKTKNTKEVKTEEPVEEKEEPSVELKSNTTVSTLSVAEYFAAKMAALRAKKEESQSPAQEVEVEVKSEMVVKEEEESEDSSSRERKKKRKKMMKLEESLRYEAPSETCEVKVEVVEEEQPNEEEDEALRRQKKRERKLKRRQERAKVELENALIESKQEEDSEGGKVDAPLSKQNKKKKERSVEDEGDSFVTEELEVEEGKKKKKKKNKKNRQVLEE